MTWNLLQRRSKIGLVSAFVLALLLLLCAAPSGSTKQQPAKPLVMRLKLDSEVEPVLATYIGEGIAEAARRNASLVLITMDTPGGLSDSMKDIIQRILGSSVPVAVYVGPTGARGASAGFFILFSADVAAMAPGTRTGAASPIVATGRRTHRTVRTRRTGNSIGTIQAYV